MSGVLVFDSGFGGLTVVRALRERGARGLSYVGDHAAFPYGALSDEAVVARVLQVLDAAVARFSPAAIVLACNTASTLALPAVRARWDVPIVGTVPAIKPAAARSRTRVISVLATPGTVARDYTRALIADFAADCDVTLTAAPHLAGWAERRLLGEAVDSEALRDEIAPAFVEREGRRTDCIALACTHFPLLLQELEAAAPWPVDWLDPADAIARRVLDVAPDALSGETVCASTAPPVAPGLAGVLAEFGFANGVEPLPVAPVA